MCAYISLFRCINCYSLYHDKQISKLIDGCLTLFAAQGCKAPKQVAEQAEHPNIIYVFPDQYRNQAMGFWSQEGFGDKVNFRGDPVHTPNIDTFARESMVLTSAQSNSPLSSPHRGMLLTGMYPNRSGVPLNCNSTRPISSLRDDAECIGDVFSKAGYDCATSVNFTLTSRPRMIRRIRDNM